MPNLWVFCFPPFSWEETISCIDLADFSLCIVGYNRFWLKVADEESKCIPHEFPRFCAKNATVWCVSDYCLRQWFSPYAMSEERQLYRLNVWCTVRVESDLRTSKKYFIDVLMFPLFGKISWRKKWLSSVKLKTKSEELECVIFILSFNLRHHSFYKGYTTICEDFYTLNGRRTLPYPYTIYMYCWTYSTW